MRFGMSAFWHALSSRLRSLAATCGATLALALAVYVLWSLDVKNPADEPVAVDGRPAFTPVVMSEPARAPAVQSDDKARLERIRREDDRALTRAVQRELKRAGCYHGPVTGAWTVATRRAMAEFTRLVNARLPVDHPDTVLLVLLESYPDASCTPDCSTERGHECPAGTSLAESGDEMADGREDDPGDTHAAAAPDSEAPEGSSQASSVEAEGDEPHSRGAAAAGGAAALSAAALTASEKSAAGEDPDTAEPQRSSRKSKKTPTPPIVRSVEKSLKSLERSIKSMLP